jgi:hypothetical protein
MKTATTVDTNGILLPSMWASPDWILTYNEAEGSRRKRRGGFLWLFKRTEWYRNTPDTRQCSTMAPVSTVWAITTRFNRLSGRDPNYPIRLLQVDPYQLVTLYLEGVITFDNLKAATEDGDHIDIPDVQIGPRMITVRVSAEMKPMAVLDHGPAS